MNEGKFSSETKKRIGDAARKRWADPEYRKRVKATQIANGHPYRKTFYIGRISEDYMGDEYNNYEYAD